MSKDYRNCNGQIGGCQVDGLCKPLTSHQLKILAQMKKDDGSIIRGDGWIELQRRSENGVWGCEPVRRDTFEVLKSAGVIKCTGSTGTGNEVWKLAQKSEGEK